MIDPTLLSQLPTGSSEGEGEGTPPNANANAAGAANTAGRDEPWAVPRVWRRETVADQAARAQQRAESWRRRGIFTALGLLLGLVGIVIGMVFWLQADPRPTLVPLFVTRYDDPNLPNPPGIARDRLALIHKGLFGAVLGAGENNPNLTRRDMESALRDLRAWSSDEAVVIYLSGLAVVDDQERIVVWPEDADPADQRTWMPLAQILDAVADCPSPRKLLVLDIMHPVAGAVGVGPGSTILMDAAADRIEAELAARPGWNVPVLTPCSPDETPHASEERARTLFGVAFEEGLLGLAEVNGGPDAAVRPDGLITLNELAQYVTRRVNIWSRQVFEAPQTPMLYESGRGLAPERFALTAFDPGNPPEPSPIPDAPIYPGWLQEGWAQRDRWRADGTADLAPRLLRQLESVLLRAERDWRYNGAVAESEQRRALADAEALAEDQRRQAGATATATATAADNGLSAQNAAGRNAATAAVTSETFRSTPPRDWSAYLADWDQRARIARATPGADPPPFSLGRASVLMTPDRAVAVTVGEGGVRRDPLQNARAGVADFLTNVENELILTTLQRTDKTPADALEQVVNRQLEAYWTASNNASPLARNLALFEAARARPTPMRLATLGRAAQRRGAAVETRETWLIHQLGRQAEERGVWNLPPIRADVAATNPAAAPANANANTNTDNAVAQPLTASGWSEDAVSSALEIAFALEQAADPRTLPWLQPQLDGAQRLRMQGWALLLSPGYVPRAAGTALLDQARARIRSARTQSIALVQAMRLRDEALHHLVGFTPFLELIPDWERPWNEVAILTQNLSQSLNPGARLDATGSETGSGESSARVRTADAAFRASMEEIQRQTEELRARLTKLREPFQAARYNALISEAATPTANAATVRALTAILATPFPNPDQRYQLWAAQYSLARRLAEIAFSSETDAANGTGADDGGGNNADAVLSAVLDTGTSKVIRGRQAARRARIQCRLLDLAGFADVPPAMRQQRRTSRENAGQTTGDTRGDTRGATPFSVLPDDDDAKRLRDSVTLRQRDLARLRQAITAAEARPEEFRSFHALGLELAEAWAVGFVQAKRDAFALGDQDLLDRLTRVEPPGLPAQQLRAASSSSASTSATALPAPIAARMLDADAEPAAILAMQLRRRLWNWQALWDDIVLADNVLTNPIANAERVALRDLGALLPAYVPRVAINARVPPGQELTANRPIPAELELRLESAPGPRRVLVEWLGVDPARILIRPQRDRLPADAGPDPVLIKNSAPAAEAKAAAAAGVGMPMPAGALESDEQARVFLTLPPNRAVVVPFVVSRANEAKRDRDDKGNPGEGDDSGALAPLGILARVTVDADTFHLRIPLTIPDEWERPEFVIAPADVTSLRDAPLGPRNLLIRPGLGRQAWKLYLRPRAEKRITVVVELQSGAAVRVTPPLVLNSPRDPVVPVRFDTPSTATAPSAPATPTPATPTAAGDANVKPAVPPLPNYAGPLTLRVIALDSEGRRRGVLLEETFRATIAEPRDIVEPLEAEFIPAGPQNDEINQLKIPLRLIGPYGRSGANSRVTMVLEPRYVPGLTGLGESTLSGELARDGDKFELFASKLALNPAADEDGIIYVRVDGHARGFKYRNTFARDGNPVRPKLDGRPALRILASESAASSEPFTVTVETDNAPRESRLELALGRLGPDGGFRADLTTLRGAARDLRLGFLADGAEGAWLFDAEVRDWSESWDVSKITGVRLIRARLLGADDQSPAIAEEIQPVLFDRSGPAPARLTDLPEQVKRGTSVNVKVMATPPLSGFRSVTAFLGRPAADNRPPAGVTPVEALRVAPNGNIWAAVVPVPVTAPLGRTDVTVILTSAVGKVTVAAGDFEVVTVVPPRPGRLLGRVVEGPRAQPDLEIFLGDPQGNLLQVRKTANDGTFLFESLTPGNYRLLSRKAVTKSQDERTVTVTPGETTRVTLELSRFPKPKSR